MKQILSHRFESPEQAKRFWEAPWKEKLEYIRAKYGNIYVDFHQHFINTGEGIASFTLFTKEDLFDEIEPDGKVHFGEMS